MNEKANISPWWKEKSGHHFPSSKGDLYFPILSFQTLSWDHMSRVSVVPIGESGSWPYANCSSYISLFLLSFIFNLIKTGWLLFCLVLITYDLAKKTFLELRLINFKQRVMKYVTLCLHHCKNIPSKREVGREQECRKYQGQIPTPSNSSICLDQARHVQDDLCSWITVSDCKFNLANFFYTLLFPISFPCYLSIPHPL